MVLAKRIQSVHVASERMSFENTTGYEQLTGLLISQIHLGMSTNIWIFEYSFDQENIRILNRYSNIFFKNVKQ